MFRMMAVLKLKSIRAWDRSRLGGEFLRRRGADCLRKKTRLRLSNLWTRKARKKGSPGVILALSSARILLIERVMMYRLLTIVVGIMAAFSFHARALDLDHLTVGSTTYSNVTVFGANKTDLFFSSDQGVSNVKLKYLSPELQKQFNYNSNAAEKVEEQQLAADKAYQQNLAASLEARVKATAEARETQTKAAYSQAGLGDAVGYRSPLGQKAPELSFTKWIGGTPDLEGKLILVSVWSPKSAACKKWIAPINELNRVFAGKMEVIGVTTATEDEVASADPKINFPCALDPYGTFLSDAGVTSLPCVLLIDMNDVVRYMGHPAAVTTNTLQSLLKGSEE
jgi:hypothetical protein